MPVRAPVMGADDRPNLTATDHSMWHPVELTHASERQRQRDQLPNHALLDQGGACGAAGPASAPGSALGGPPGARRATPSDTPIESARTSRSPVRRTAVFLALDCPARRRRVKGAFGVASRLASRRTLDTTSQARIITPARAGGKKVYGNHNSNNPPSSRSSVNVTRSR